MSTAVESLETSLPTVTPLSASLGLNALSLNELANIKSPVSESLLHITALRLPVTSSAGIESSIIIPLANASLTRVLGILIFPEGSYNETLTSFTSPGSLLVTE